MKQDWTIQFENQYYQLDKIAHVQPKQTITVRRHMDGGISLWHQQRRLVFRAIEKPVVATKTKQGINAATCSISATKNRHKTPWGKFNPCWLTPNKQVAPASTISAS